MGYPTTYPGAAVDADVRDLAGVARPRLTSSGEIARRLAALDEAYIRAEFVPLDQVAHVHGNAPATVRAWVAQGLLAQPAYRLDDGTDMVPADYFTLLDDAGSLDQLAAHFRDRYVLAAGELALPVGTADVDDEWQAYLGGGFFVCLRRATPETIARKARLITDLEMLLARPAPDDPAWSRRLVGAVDALADIERRGAVLDPPRWGGPMSPQWYGSYLRSRYPQSFAVARSAS